MPMNEEQMRHYDERVPELGRLAVAKAVAKARASGQIVTIRVGENLVEVRPDGRQTVLKKLPPKVGVGSGRKFKLR